MWSHKDTTTMQYVWLVIILFFIGIGTFSVFLG